MQKKPIGVTILSVLMFIGVLEYAGLAILAAVSPERVRALLEGMTPGGVMGPGILLKLGAFLPVYFLALAVFSGIVARGFWRLKNWARLVLVILGAASVLIGFVELARGASALSRSALGFGFLRLAIPTLIVGYLCTPKVKAAFGGQPPSDSGAV